MNTTKLAPIAAALALTVLAAGCNHSMRDSDTAQASGAMSTSTDTTTGTSGNTSTTTTTTTDANGNTNSTNSTTTDTTQDNQNPPTSP